MGSFIKRFYIYQKERFPFATHGLLIAAFSFSAISYSRICRGAVGFIAWQPYLICIFNTIGMFLLLRICDEHKDAEDDKLYRSYLPVPRGIISLQELKYIGFFVAGLQITVQILTYPHMLVLYFVAMLYMMLMLKEFFIVEWLRKRQFWYVVSHMLIIPLVDVYASGYDWFLTGAAAPNGLIFFFLVSFMSGIVLEIGRKIKIPEKEEPGVISYTNLMGHKKAPVYWILCLFSSMLLAMAACYYAKYNIVPYIILAVLFISCCIPALMFRKNMQTKYAKQIEISSGIWSLCMYLILGAGPMIGQLI